MGINLRRPTLAEILPGQIKREHLENNIIDNTKIEDGAVDLTTNKVIGLLPNNKLSVISDVSRIQDNLISLAKVQDDVKLNTFVGGEVEQNVLGTVETDLVETGFIKILNKLYPKKVRVVASLKVEGSGSIAYLKVYIDDELTERAVMQTGNQEYELVTTEIDISDVSNGRHKLKIVGYTDNTESTCWNDFVDILLVR